MTGMGESSAMYTAIRRQPEDLRRVLADGWEDAQEAALRVRSARRVFLAGIGTSYHGALMGSWLLRHVGVDARAETSFNLARYAEHYALHSDDVVVVLSHTGAKRYSLDALRVAVAAGASVLSVGGVDAAFPGSALTLRTTETESSSAHTTSHLTAMVVLAQVAVCLREGHPDLRAALMEIPAQVESILDAEDVVQSLAERVLGRHTYVVGGGPSEVAALEAVIKSRESAYVRVDGMALEQFLHGPFVCLEPDDVVVLINVEGASTERNEEAARLFAELGAAVCVVGEPLDELQLIAVPQTLEILSPILTSVPFQLLGVRLAALRNVSPDTFRMHEPRFRNAINRIAL